jgi:hypothetical protein
MGMTIDASDFEKGLTNLVKTLEPEATARGLFDAGERLIIDAIEQKPYAPVRERHLIDSGRTDIAQITETGVEVVAGFNIEYAARWHELTPAEDATINWTLPGSGRKYLESKLIRFKEKYMKIVAKSLEDTLKRGGA